MSCGERVNACTQTSNKLTLCVGICAVEIVQDCEKFPMEDGKEFASECIWQRSGSASNICTVLRELGAKAEFLGVLSSATSFQFILDDFIRRSIKFENCPIITDDPPLQTVIISKENNTCTTLQGNVNFPKLTNEKFRKLNLKPYSWIHFEAINPEETLRMMQAVRTYNEWVCDRITISVELKQTGLDNTILADMADIVFMNKDFAKNLDWTEMKDAVYALRHSMKTPADMKKPTIICAWGERGVCCLDYNDTYLHVPAVQPKTVVSHLGAGDTFIASIIFGLLNLKLSLTQAIKFANFCASYKLGLNGFDGISEFIRCACQGCKGGKGEHESSCRM